MRWVSVAASGPVAVVQAVFHPWTLPLSVFPGREIDQDHGGAVSRWYMLTHRVSASERCRGACGGCWALPYLSPWGGLFFSQLPVLVLVMASAQPSPDLLSAASSRTVSPLTWEGTDQSASSDWLVWGSRHLPFGLHAGQFWRALLVRRALQGHLGLLLKLHYGSSSPTAQSCLPQALVPEGYPMEHTSQSLFPWAPNLRQEVTAILPHFGPVENVPYWSCRIPQGHRAGEGQRENCTAVDSKSIASRCFLLTRFSPPPAAALPSFVLDSDANAPVVGVGWWAGADLMLEPVMSWALPALITLSDGWAHWLGPSQVSRLFHGDSPSKMPTHFLAPVGIRSLARIKIGDREIKWTLQHSK